MSETTTEQTTPATGAETPTPTTEPTPKSKPEGRDAPNPDKLGEPGLKALQQEREARERLEREVGPLRQQMEALRTAFGGEATTGKPEDVVATLQQQVAEMRHDTLVERVARSHGITDDNDVTVLRAVKDEALMTRLAERLRTPPGPTVPAPDQGQGARSTTPQAEADAEYAKYFPN
ncbi:MAG: hypothetical protein ABR616_03515 [Dermatophilaceae bacterium]